VGDAPNARSNTPALIRNTIAKIFSFDIKHLIDGRNAENQTSPMKRGIEKSFALEYSDRTPTILG
jgi:hypothetical protein